MWIFDKHGNAINSDQIMGLFVGTDPDDEGAYEVQANNSGNSLIAQFAVGEPMDEAAANTLYARMTTMLGVTDLTD
jgi:hypothetical protein